MNPWIAFLTLTGVQNCNRRNTKKVNFIKKIYNYNINSYISITPHMQQICKIGIKLLDDSELSDDGITNELRMPILSDNDCYDPDSTEYNVNYFDTKVDDFYS